MNDNDKHYRIRKTSLRKGCRKTRDMEWTDPIHKPAYEGIDPRMYTFDQNMRARSNPFIEKIENSTIVPHIALDKEKVAIIDDLDISVPGLYGVSQPKDDSSEETPAVISRMENSLSSGDEKACHDSPMCRKHSISNRKQINSMTSSKFGENFYSRISDDNTLPRPNFFVPPLPINKSPPMPPRYPTSFKNRHQHHHFQQQYCNDDERLLFRHQQQQQTSNNLINFNTKKHYDSHDYAFDDFQLRFLAQASNGRVFVPSLPSHSNSPISDFSQPKMADFNSSQSVGAVYYRNNRTSIIGSPSDPTNSDKWYERGLINPNQSILSTQYPSCCTGSKPIEDVDSKCPHMGIIYGKNIKTIVSWKCAAAMLACFSVILLAFLCYFIGTYFKSRNYTYYFPPTSNDYALSESASSATSYVFGRKESFHLKKSEGWRTAFYLPRQEKVRMRLGAPEASIFGLYGSRDVLPSHARFEFFHPFNSRRQTPVSMGVAGNGDGKKRSISKGSKVDITSLPSTTMEVIKILDEGVWHVFIHNDIASFESTFSFLATVHDVDNNDDGDDDDSEVACRNNCYGRGDCIEGRCRCYDGYHGVNCLHVTCPTICSGNGVFLSGRCHCEAGWTGKKCDIGSTCLNITCNNAAICRDGLCLCAPGFVGDNCDEEICTSECVHGFCNDKICVCRDGWEGTTCLTKTCDPRCSGHKGSCDNGTCLCKPGWYGSHCSIEGCPNECSSHGHCKQIHSFPLLTSLLLSTPSSSSSSSSASSPSSFSSLSSTFLQWHCKCEEGWTGSSCNVAVEVACDDNLDNDHDTLLDCNDPDCCLSPLCKDSIPCRSSPNPMEILLRKQSPSSTDSFYERLKFLIEDNSVQIHSSPTSFNQTSQVSVIRGKVVDQNNSPIVGVRVNVSSQPLYGFTLTREHGLFDILVNGGGSVTLNFLRQSFKPRKKTVTVPWNRIITMDTVVMTAEGQNETFEPEGITCYIPQPLIHMVRVLSVWEHKQERACHSLNGIIPEMQVLQEILNIPGTDAYLVYRSSTSSGYMSTLIIQMTPKVMPKNLIFVWLKIQIEGLKYEKQFEADPLLAYKFSWNRRNAYNQKVFGVVNAIVSVGYQYMECKKIFWEVKSAPINGFDISSSELGKWNLNIHHAYNFQDGILHRGDGTSVYLKQQPPKFITILGNGNSRKPDCSNCDGRTLDAKLSAPVALASGRDGSLYIGDYNFIRMVDPSRERITSILKMSHSKVSYKYHMTVNPVDGKLYISDSHSLRVIMVKTMGPDKNIEENFDKVAGTGEQCYPGDQDVCGDGGLAKNAKLFHPKGIAVDKDGTVYFADGANIRSIDSSKRIQTVIGSQGLPRSWKPFPCSGFARAEEVFLHWPTSLAINPLDNTLHILDNNLILKLTKDNLVVLVMGSLLHCPSSNGSSPDNEELVGTRTPLYHSQYITFSPNGQLFVVETNGKELNRVRATTNSGEMENFAGASSGCDCSTDKCKCFDPKEQLAKNMLLNNPSSIAISPDGVVHIADMANLRVHSIVATLPAHDKIGQYEVLNSEDQEIYIFNRYGQHISTKNIITDSFMYNFTYSVNSYYGKLTTFVDGSGNAVNIVRDYRFQVKELQSPNGQISHFILNSMGQLQTFIGPDNMINFTYNENSGLISSKISSKHGALKLITFEYDKLGRIVSTTNHNGGQLKFESGINQLGSLILAKKGLVDVISTTMEILHDAFIVEIDGFKLKTLHPSDGLMRVIYPFNLEVTTESEPHPLLNMDQPLILKRKINLPKNKTYSNEWRFYHYDHDNIDKKTTLNKKKSNIGWDPKHSALKGHLRSIIKVRHVDHYRYGDHKEFTKQHNLAGYKGKSLFINDEHILTVEFDRQQNSELVIDKDYAELFVMQYDKSGHILSMNPINVNIKKLIGSFNNTYNNKGRLVFTQFNKHVMAFEYIEPKGLLLEERANGRVLSKYSYGGPDNDLITSRTLTNGAIYKFNYDSVGRLESILMPDGSSSFKFKVMNILGILRVLYGSPALKRSEFIADYDNLGRVLREIHPSRKRMVTYNYSSFSDHVVSASFDGCLINHIINKKSLKIQESTLIKSNYTSILTQDSESPIIEWQVIRMLLEGTEDKLMQVVSRVDVSYMYNDNLRVSRITSTFAELLKTTQVEYSYDIHTSKPVKIGPIRIQWQNLCSRRIVSDENVEIISEWEEQGQYLFEKLMSSGDKVIFESWSRINADGKQLSWQRRIGFSDSITLEYSYYSVGLPNEVSIDGKVAWKYFYDANGELTEVSLFGERRIFAASVSFDEDGFMTTMSYVSRGANKRQEFMLHHNSLGQLISIIDASNSNSIIEFFYDPKSRLTMIQYSSNNFFQYFYTDPSDPSKLTHVYDSLNNKLNLLFYHEDGRLFSITRQSESFYVSTDPFGSPVIVVNNAGKLMQQINYDPLGSITEEMVSGFPLYIGFCGAILENRTGLLYIRGRWYDPNNARYTSTNHHDLITLISKHLHFELQKLNTHAVNVGIWSQPNTFGMDIGITLTKIGYNVKQMVPSISFRGQLFEDHYHESNSPIISKTESFIQNQLTPISPILKCSFYREIVHKISRISFIKKSLLSGFRQSTSDCDEIQDMFNQFSTEYFIQPDVNFYIDVDGVLVFHNQINHTFTYYFTTFFNSSKLISINKDNQDTRLSLNFVKTTQSSKQISDDLHFEQLKKFQSIKITKLDSQRTIITVENDVIVLTLNYDIIDT